MTELPDNRNKPVFVFVDTGIFVENHFDFDNQFFARFREFCENGSMEMITTDLTVWEIERKFTESVQRNTNKAENESNPLVRKALKAAEFATLIEKHKQEFDDFWFSIGQEIIPISHDAMRASLEAYKNKKPPFHTDKKEFPDSYAAEQLKIFQKERGCFIVACVKDGLFFDSLVNEEDFYAVKDWRRVLEFITHINNPAPDKLFKSAIKHIHSNLPDVEREIRNNVDESLFFIADMHKEILEVDILNWHIGELSLTLAEPHRIVISAPVSIRCQIEVSNPVVVHCSYDDDDTIIDEEETSSVEERIEGSVEFEFTYDNAYSLDIYSIDLSLPKQTEIDVNSSDY